MSNKFFREQKLQSLSKLRLGVDAYGGADGLCNNNCAGGGNLRRRFWAVAFTAEAECMCSTCAIAG